MSSRKPVIHGRDHLPGGADPMCPLVIDSTDNIGDCWGVHSEAASSGYVLTSDGAGGSVWQAVSGGVPTITPAYGLYNTAIATISAGGSTTLSWQYVSGSTLLNLTTATAPAVTARGVYAVMANIQCTGAFINTGRTITGLLEMGSGDLTFVHGFVTGGATNTSPVAFCLTGLHAMSANDPFSIQINNKDSASRNIQGFNIGVLKLFDY